MSLFKKTVLPKTLSRQVPANLRFWMRVDKWPAEPVAKAKGCWLWTGKTHSGYGTLVVAGKRKMAHVYAWELFNGPMRPGLWGLHKCDQRRCVNPEHIYPGTVVENGRDRAARGKAQGYRPPVRPPKPATESKPRRWKRTPENKLYGENNGRAKLTPEQVLKIRELYATGDYTKRRLGRLFKVSDQLIGKIVRHELWTQV